MTYPPTHVRALKFFFRVNVRIPTRVARPWLDTSTGERDALDRDMIPGDIQANPRLIAAPAHSISCLISREKSAACHGDHEMTTAPARRERSWADVRACYLARRQLALYRVCISIVIVDARSDGSQ